VTGLVPAQHIASAEPDIARPENIAKKLRLGLGGVDIALKSAQAAVVFLDLLDCFARFVCITPGAKAMLVTHWLTGLKIMPDQCDGKPMYQEWRNAPDSAGLLLTIVERDRALRRHIKLENMPDHKPLFEGVPDISAQPVAAAQSEIMIALA
jgi:hypothetical protein